MKRILRSMHLISSMALMTTGYYSGCHGTPISCEDKDEPTSVVVFANQVPQYDQVRAFNTTYDWSGHFYRVDDAHYQGWAKSLPMSTVSDTTTYLFERWDRVDTLAISYSRNVNYESVDCGFTLTLSDLQLLDNSTFKSVEFFIHTGSRNVASMPEDLPRSDLPTTYKNGNNVYQISILD